MKSVDRSTWCVKKNKKKRKGKKKEKTEKREFSEQKGANEPVNDRHSESVLKL